MDIPVLIDDDTVPIGAVYQQQTNIDDTCMSIEQASQQECQHGGQFYQSSGYDLMDHNSQHVQRHYTQSSPTSSCGRRLPMVVWLRHMIDDVTVPGVKWIDRERQIFLVVWKHISGRDWCREDGVIFKLWAMYTGRYREAYDVEDWPTWKTRFRTALDRLPTVVRIQELDNRSYADQPYRVYQFVERPTGTKSKGRRRSSEKSSTETAMDTKENTCTVVKTENESEDQASHSSLFMGLKSTDLIRISSVEYSAAIKDVDTPGSSLSEYCRTDSFSSVKFGDLLKCNSTEVREALREIVNDVPENRENQLRLTVKYCQFEMLTCMCSNKDGCRILYDPTAANSLYMSPDNVDNIYFPSIDSAHLMGPAHQRFTSEILEASRNGVKLEFEDGNILATRKCRSSIYVATPTLHNGATIKLSRNQRTVVFDYTGYFIPALEKYVHGTGPKPSPELLISFGQSFVNDRESINNLLVRVYVLHMEAFDRLTRVSCTSPLSMPLEFSEETEQNVFNFTNRQ